MVIRQSYFTGQRISGPTEVLLNCVKLMQIFGLTEKIRFVISENNSDSDGARISWSDNSHTHLSDTWGYRRPRLQWQSPCYWIHSDQKEEAAFWDTWMNKKIRWVIVLTSLISLQLLNEQRLDFSLRWLSWKILQPLWKHFQRHCFPVLTSLL